MTDSEPYRALPSRNLQSLPFGDELLAAWDAIDGKGRDIAGIRTLCLEDRYYLLVQVCKRVDAWHPWVYARCREVELAPDDRLDLWARYHYKSTIITFAGIIQEILRDREVTIAILSNTNSVAGKFMRQIKFELETNGILKLAFPDALWDDPVNESPLWSVEKGIVVRRDGNPAVATLEAHGLVDGMPTGSHYRLRVYDDVVTEHSVTTPDQIAKTTQAWELSDNLGMPGGRRWHIGTRYSYADTYEAILKRGILTPRLYPATDDGTEDGNPVMLSADEWAEKKITLGRYILACQMLQNPLSGSEAMFDVADLQTYEVRPATLNLYLLVDPARSKKKGSANTAMVVIGIDAAMNKYLLDGYNHRMDLQERWTRMRDLYIKWRQSPGVQNVRVGYERYGALADLDYFYERMRTPGEPVSFEILELEWPYDGEGSKLDRVQRLGPDFRAHRFWLPYPTDDDRLTSNQQRIVNGGHPYRVARPIKRKDSEGNIYDLSVQFKEQVHFFPFGGLKDLIDAASRIYDMSPTAPVLYDESSLEPEIP